MLARDKIAIYISILPVIFVIIGAYMLSNTEESISAAAISQINKIKAGSANEEEKISEEILLRKDIGTGTSSSSLTSILQTTSTIITTQTSVATSSIVTTYLNGSGSSITTTTTTTTSDTLQPTTILLTPSSARDVYGNDQISPDDDEVNPGTDGTVDLSNNDARWLTQDGEYIEVEDWDDNIDGNPAIIAAIARCEIDWANPKGGDLSFLYNIGSGWSGLLCRQFVASGTGGNYYCDLYANGIDTVSEVNNLEIRCRMNNTKSGGIGFSIDSIALNVAIQ